MKPPKCRLCWHEHWSNEPHVFDVSNEQPVTNEPVTNISVTNTVTNKPDIVSSSADRVKKWRQSHPELNRERQKLLMRKRRAGSHT